VNDVAYRLWQALGQELDRVLFLVAGTDDKAKIFDMDACGEIGIECVVDSSPSEKSQVISGRVWSFSRNGKVVATTKLAYEDFTFTIKSEIHATQNEREDS